MTETESNRINPADGERFAQDLKKIREQSGVTLDDLNQLTKIPLNLLSDFEVNALLGNPLFNQVYLRSLVRTYARSTGVDPDLALECLESATIGMYHGELAQNYLGKPESKAEKPVERRSKPLTGQQSLESDSDEQPRDRVTAPGSDRGREIETSQAPPAQTTHTGQKKSSRRRRAAKNVRSQKAVAKGNTKELPNSSAAKRTQSDPKDPEVRSDENKVSGSSSPAPATQSGHQASEVAGSGERQSKPGDSDRGRDRTMQSRSHLSNSPVVDISSHAPDTPGEQSLSNAKPGIVIPRSSLSTIVSSVAAIGLLVVVTFVLWKSFGGGSSENAAVVADDTTSIERVLTPQESTAVVTPAVVAPQLGETIRLDVVASGGNLRPIRVRVDRDLRRPYWIDKDSVRTFEFTDQIVLEENIELISLSISGFDYPLGLNPGQKVVISRELVESFYSSLPSR